MALSTTPGWLGRAAPALPTPPRLPKDPARMTALLLALLALAPTAQGPEPLATAKAYTTVDHDVRSGCNGQGPGVVFDGANDFAGTSGESMSTQATGQTTTTPVPSGVLRAFEGTGTVVVPIEVAGRAEITAQGAASTNVKGYGGFVVQLFMEGSAGPATRMVSHGVELLEYTYMWGVGQYPGTLTAMTVAITPVVSLTSSVEFLGTQCDPGLAEGRCSASVSLFPAPRSGFEASQAENMLAAEAELRHQMAGQGLALGTRKYTGVLYATAWGACAYETQVSAYTSTFDCDPTSTLADCGIDYLLVGGGGGYDPWPYVDCDSGYTATWDYGTWPNGGTLYCTD